MLKEILSYNPDTGEFIRVGVNSGSCKNDKRVGSIKPRGQIQIKIGKKLYLAHRLAWLYVKGSLPTEEIDHKNLNPSDNRFDNLRLASHSQNMSNIGVRKSNTSGLKGVSKNGNGWAAQVKHNKIRYYLGTFSSKEEAHGAYLIKSKELFGEFARGNM
jgi:hypothetical protein